MQIGIDLGASKIESVILDEQGNEKHRERVDCPKNYNSIIEKIKKDITSWCLSSWSAFSTKWSSKKCSELYMD